MVKLRSIIRQLHRGSLNFVDATRSKKFVATCFFYFFGSKTSKSFCTDTRFFYKRKVGFHLLIETFFGKLCSIIKIFLKHQYFLNLRSIFVITS